MQTPEDPFTAFLASHRRGLPPSRGVTRFNAGEHAWLAGRGAERACEELRRTRGLDVDPGLFTAIRRQHGREELNYGELVALSGDFYETPEQLFEEQPALLPWLWEGNDLTDLRAIFAKELSWIDARRVDGKSVPYPEETMRLAWNAKSYLELALRNVDHFGWHNVVAYCNRHGEALKLAAEARGRVTEGFRRAIYVNAFADHFLTDGFAAGHIRVPRAQIIDWAAERGFSDKIAGSLSKLLHDQDGHVNLNSLHGSPTENDRPAHDGLEVMDAAGERWCTRCDGQLFLPTLDKHSLVVEKPVRAVCASVLELLLAWKRGEMPEGVYHATRSVPFPAPGTPTLVQKFPAGLPEDALTRLWESVGWYSKVPWIAGLEKAHILALFEALPELMQRFRNSVARFEQEHPNTVANMDPAYVAAFRGIA